MSKSLCSLYFGHTYDLKSGKYAHILILFTVRVKKIVL